MKPVSNQEASEEIRALYSALCKALGVPQVPLFFAYLANYPLYFTTVVPELLENFKDPRFHELSSSIGDELSNRMKEYVPKNKEIEEWLNRHQYSPSMYHTRISLRHVHEINTALAFVFLALREAVKGWAIAAPKLEAEHSPQADHEVKLENKNEDFIYQEIENIPNVANKVESSTSILQSQQAGMEQNLYIEYLHLCENWFTLELKKEEYLYFRVISEEAILLGLDNLPHPVFSPINRVIQLAPGHKDYMDLCFLLSEHFPTIAVQRLLFSGYMRF
ncbi:hypothetical protein KBD81_00630 [Candidatus Woesebacteria bacterium]|nr:hypothetical protein [Candidatus Woesebacteria bacterium]